MTNTRPTEHTPRSAEWYTEYSYVHLDFFDDTDQELKSLSMSVEDVAKFREWQKKFNIEPEKD